MIGFMKSLGGFYITSGNQSRLRSPGVAQLIGQGPYDSPSVFSFFLPEYQPGGWATKANIVAPEAQVLTGRRVTTMIDSMLTMSKFGLTSCHNGIGNSLDNGDCPVRDGDFSKSDGWLRYAPPEGASADELVSNLSLWMTAGRLSETSHQFVKEAIESMYNGEDKAKAVRVAQQLVASTAEFSSTNIVRKTNDSRSIRGYTQEPRHEYKAVVYMYLPGGNDSFNMLVPGNCANKQMYAEYKKARGGHALSTDQILTINAAGSGQICDNFGVHHKLPKVKELYDDGDASFFC
jgi:hypothetical protein